MQRFNGFPPGKARTVAVPGQFFSELLPMIDDLAELKVTLYLFWALQQQEGEYRYLTLRELLKDTRFLSGLAPDPDEAAEAARAGLARAVERGTLLHVQIPGVDEPQDVYFVNTVRGRNAVRAIEAGRFVPGDRDVPIALLDERPNIFALYEENIGPLSPLISDQLRAAEQDYPAAWIEEAFRLAVERNKRSWRYIAAILQRWESEGKDRGVTQQPTQADRYRYVRGSLSDIIDF